MKEKFKKIGKWIFNSFIWLGALLLIIDIITKNIVVANHEAIEKAIEKGQGIQVIPGFLRINYVINKNLVMGASTGSNAGDRALFISLALVIVGLIIVGLAKLWAKTNKFYRATFMMVIAGALGNVIDRIFYSPEYLGKDYNGVVDWIDFYGISFWKWNFNIADSAVVVAAFMLIIYMIVVEIKDYREKNKNKVAEDNTKVLSKTEIEKNQYLESEPIENKETTNEKSNE